MRCSIASFRNSLLGASFIALATLSVSGAAAQDVAPDAAAPATGQTDPLVTGTVGGADVGGGETAQACFLPPIKLSSADVSEFLAAPGAMLNDYPEGGIQMSSRVRALAGSDAATLDPLLALIATANLDQRAAIGSGLARAAMACAPSSAAYAQLIQQKVAELANDDLLTAFLSASNDLETAALGAAGGGGFVGGAPALGGVGNPGPSNSVEGDESNPNRSGNFPINRRTGNFTVGLDASNGNADVSPVNPL
ncbi:hypothetical protein [Chthonobacter albigriseus]|uniref:hypothetical protein n=1 Tax=Chthonobacter albigriseus TaxID=1683161 RepID=UPI0015EF7E06|nr:hypothetical protein [Chthonobacter albigriseus]